MGFFNGILRGLGFEGEKKEPQIKEEPVVYKENVAEYNLNDINETKEELNSFIPANQQEVQNIVDILKQGQAVSVNFELIKGNEFVRALDFMSGATYVLNGKIKKVENKVFLFYPNVKERV